MTLPMLADLSEYWSKNPPLHILVRDIAIVLGAFQPTRDSKAPAVENDIEKFMAESMALCGGG